MMTNKIYLDGAAYCLGAVNRDCWYLYTLNPFSSKNGGYSLRSLLAAGVYCDDGFEAGSDGASDGGSDGTEDCCSDGCSDEADSSDDSLESGLEADSDIPEHIRQRLNLHKRSSHLTGSMRFQSLNKFNNRGVASIAEPDQTLEIMMSDLDPEVMKIFTKEISATAAEATQVINSCIFST